MVNKTFCLILFFLNIMIFFFFMMNARMLTFSFGIFYRRCIYLPPVIGMVERCDLQICHKKFLWPRPHWVKPIMFMIGPSFSYNEKIFKPSAYIVLHCVLHVPYRKVCIHFEQAVKTPHIQELKLHMSIGSLSYA